MIDRRALVVRGMIARGFAFLFGALVVLAAMPADAQILFGTREDIRPIQDVGLTGSEGQPLFLGYKTSTIYFVGGLAMWDDGYVLGLRADADRFIDMPEGEALRSFQERGLLPNPLPRYSVGVIEYVRGFSFWIVVLLLGGIYLAVFHRRRGNRRQPRY